METSEDAKCNCQTCGQPIAFPPELHNTPIECPHCTAETLLLIPPAAPTTPPAQPKPTPPKTTAASATPVLSPEEQQLRKVINDLVGKADLFSNASTLCMVLAGLIFVITLLAAAVNQNSEVEGIFIIGFSAVAGAISCAIWLFLAAQIIHIRANTEK